MKVEVKKSERKLCPEGFHPARLIQVIDLGTQKNEAYNKFEKRIRLAFDCVEQTFETEEGESVSHIVTREFAFKMTKKAHLRKFVEQLLGKKLEDGKPFDFEDIAGEAFNLNIVHNKSEKNGETYANINTGAPLTKGQKVAKSKRDVVVFDIDNIDDEVLESLPDWLQDVIMKSEEYKAYTGGDFEEKDKKAKGKAAAPAKKTPAKAPAKKGK